MWNSSQHTREETLRWCWLRAIEWGKWPLFVSQLFAPLLLLIFPWHQVVIGFFLANMLWTLVRYHFINTGLANAAANFMIVKWPLSIGCAAYLTWQHQYPVAALVLLWPAVVIVLGVMTPTQIGRIQTIMMRQFGYERNQKIQEM